MTAASITAPADQLAQSAKELDWVEYARPLAGRMVAPVC